MSKNNEVYDEIEMINISDAATVQDSKCETLFMLEDPYKFWMYDVPRAQMDGGEKFKVTNNTNLLNNFWWYNQWFCPCI